MISSIALALLVAQLPQPVQLVPRLQPVPTPRLAAALADTGAGAVVAPAPAPPSRIPADTPVVRRPRAIEYSDMYFTRLTIHRIASYTMLPLFAGEYALGQNLLQDAQPPGWMKPAHGLAAGGIAVLFGVNTITGVWNLWDARHDPAGRTRRTLHSVLMLASDAGFVLTGATAPGHHEQFQDYSTYLHRERVHRGIAVGSIALSTVGGVMMWFWKQ